MLVKVGGVETSAPELLGPARANTSGRPQLAFCVTKGIVTNTFRSRNSSVMDDAYYREHFADFLRREAPFESIETVAEDDAEGRGCDVLLSPYIMVYVTPLGSVEATVGVYAIANAKPPQHLLVALTRDEKSVEAGGSKVGRVVYNAFLPGMPLYGRVAAEKEGDARSFEEVAKRYREAAVKPPLPEEARKFQVQAEAAFARKEFGEAAARYRDALKIAPWWPEGYFNRALLLGEMGRYGNAIGEMRKYLALVPDAPDARAAQDKIYEWEDLAIIQGTGGSR